MQPIHLAIGIVEGLATSAVVIFVWKARPEIIKAVSTAAPVGNHSLRKVTIGFLAAAVVTGGVLSWFASSNPDGLEWAMFKTAGTDELDTPRTEMHATLARVQEKTALLPDYGFQSKKPEPAEAAKPEPAWIGARLFQVWSAVRSPCSWPGCSDLRSSVEKNVEPGRSITFMC